jgi:hypothetical protein
MTERTHATDLQEFDHKWLEAMERTPLVRAVVGLTGLTRLGEHPATLDRLAAIVDQPVEETTALVRRELGARIDDGMVYWDDPYPGDQARRIVHLGDRQVAMGSGCGPDVFMFAAVLDVPFQVEKTCPVTGRRSAWSSSPTATKRSIRRARSRCCCTPTICAHS